MKTFLIAVLTLLACASAVFPRTYVKTVSSQTEYICFAEIMRTNADKDTFCVSFTSGLSINFLAVDLFSNVLVGSPTVEVSWWTVPFPDSEKLTVHDTVSADQADVLYTKYFSFTAYADSVTNGSLPVPIAWRKSDGTTTTSLDLTDDATYTSYVETKQAGAASDMFSPTAGGRLYMTVTTTGANAEFEGVLCVSYKKQ